MSRHRHRHRLDRLEQACHQQDRAALDSLTVTERAGRVCALMARACRRAGRPRLEARWARSAAQFHSGRDDPQTQAQAEQWLQKVRLAVQQHPEASQ